jgi:hypothetical protein
MARVALTVYALPGVFVGLSVAKDVFKEAYQMAVEDYKKNNSYIAIFELTFFGCGGSLIAGAIAAAGWPLVLSMKRSAAKNKV